MRKIKKNMLEELHEGEMKTRKQIETFMMSLKALVLLSVI